MSPAVKKWAMFAVRWGIAVAGIWYVIVNIYWRDRVFVLNATNHPVETRLAAPAEEDSPTVTLLDDSGGPARTVSRGDLVNQADRNQVTLRLHDGVKTWPLLGLDLSPDLKSARRVLAGNPQTRSGEWIDAAAVVGGYEVRVPYPRVQAGLKHMLHKADPTFLWASLLIFPITYIVTGLRWHALLLALDIQLGVARAFVLNMVGAFYNTFMPGSTGGDVLKAYYAARHTHHRTRAVMSVIVDRAIGLLALIILGGAMAAMQWDEPACRQVAVAAAGLIGMLVLGLLVFYEPTLRRLSGLDFILRRMPMQRQVTKAVETMEIYRRRPWLVVGALLVTFPVHMTVIISAMFAGMAFKLPLELPYYWVAVPVIVLAGAMPISPQGAGVMEFFAIVLTRRQGCTVAQAFALTMSIRLVQITWNLAGGIFVLRGGYHTPTPKEQAEQEAEEGLDASGDGRPSVSEPSAMPTAAAGN